MEYVPKISLDSVKITPVITDNAVELEYEIKGDSACLGDELLVEAVVSFDGMFVAKMCVCHDSLSCKNGAGCFGYRGECLCLGCENLVSGGTGPV